MPSLQDFWARIQSAGGQIHDGLHNARMNFRDGLINRLGQMPSMLGMQPRPGGTAGGGWQMPQGGMGRLQMPQGFAAQLPFGAAAGGGARPMGMGMGHREPDAEPDADADDTRGNYVPKDPAARAAVKQKGNEIGKKAKGY